MAHSHSGGLAMLDTLAAHSPLREVSPGLKVVFTVAVLFAAIAAGHWAAGLFVFFTMVLAMAVLGGLPLRKIAALLRIPLLFLVVGCAVVLVEWRNGGFAVTKASALAAGTLFLQALGAVSRLFFFSTTTPMPCFIEVLRRWHLPDVVIELMYLIYRYLFVLLTVQRQMTISATARLGYRGFAARWPPPERSAAICSPRPSGGAAPTLTPWRPGATMAAWPFGHGAAAQGAPRPGGCRLLDCAAGRDFPF